MNRRFGAGFWVWHFVGFAAIVSAAAAAVFWIAGVAERGAVESRAREQLERTHAVATALVESGGAGQAVLDDRFARRIAGAAGSGVLLVDTSTVGDPRILGSSLETTPDLLTVAREQRVDWSPGDALEAATADGVEYFVDGALFTTPDGVVAGMIVLHPTDPAWYGGNLIRLTAVAAGVIALVLGLVLVMALGGRLSRPMNEIVEAARRAMKGDSAVGVSLDTRGPLADLGIAVQSLIERARAAPSVPETDLAEISTTATWAVPQADVEPVDGANLVPGTVFADRYEIIELLGQSDVRTAYKVRDRELDETLVLKTLHADLFSGDNLAVEGFKADLRVARRLSHRNILRTHDFGEWRGAYYVTMDLVDAIPLRNLLDRRGRLNVASTVALMTQVSRALGIAHEDGVVHGDLRPRSLLLSDDGVIKVADFGLASPAHRTRVLAQSSTDAAMFAYVAPEVLTGGKSDRRSDIYSIGVVTYECLVGRPPFQAEDPQDLINQQLHQPPPTVASLDPAIPGELSELLSRALSPQPETRPQTADQLRELLSQTAAATPSVG